MLPERAFKQYIIHPHRIPFNSVRSLSIRSSFSTRRNYDSLTTDARTSVANDVWEPHDALNHNQLRSDTPYITELPPGYIFWG